VNSVVHLGGVEKDTSKLVACGREDGRLVVGQVLLLVAANRVSSSSFHEMIFSLSFEI